MNKKIKKIIGTTAFIGLGMYAFNKFIEYTASCRNLTKEDDEKYFDWKNGKIFYKQMGQGSPILLIHDLNPTSSSFEWSEIIEQLAENHTVYALDLIGCGKSDKPSSTYINYFYVQLINDFINKIIKEKTDVVVTGESFSIVVMAARMDANTIGKITAINPTDILYNLQTPDNLNEVKKKILELPLIGTFIYNIIANQRTINMLFSKKYYYKESKIKSKLVDIYYESAHLQGSNGKYLYGSIVGKYTNINIIHAIKKITNEIQFIISDQQSTAKEYLSYKPDIVINYVEECGYLPQLERPKKVLSYIN